MRLSPIALPLCCISFLVYCLHIPYRAGFLCVFKCYLKDPDFGAVRTHEVLPPCPFFAASKKKKTTERRQPATQLRGPDAPERGLVCLCSQQHVAIHCWCQTPPVRVGRRNRCWMGRAQGGFTHGCRHGAAQRRVALLWWPIRVLPGFSFASRASSVSGVS